MKFTEMKKENSILLIMNVESKTLEQALSENFDCKLDNIH